jgi:glyoxylase-like metal-dependent hydrolase (beta-lactamase superfamily II)
VNSLFSPLDGDARLPYRLEEAAPGVLVALAQGGGRAGANAVLVDLGDRVLAIDAGMTRAVGAALQAAAVEYFGRAPSWLAYTHGHADHVWGAAGFGGEVEIIATAVTAQRMVAATGREGDWLRDHAPAEVARIDAMLAAQPTPTRRAQLEAGRTYYTAALAELDNLRVRLPTMTFDHRLVLHGSRRRAEIITWGGGHTPGDAVVWLPDCALLATGDLATVDAHPWLGGGDAIEWLRILATLETLGVDTVAPGHGELSDGGALAAVADYIRCILESAEERPIYSANPTHSAATDDEVAQWARSLPIPSQWATWAFSSFYAQNLISLASRLLDQPPS